jgi:hypothetical protein
MHHILKKFLVNRLIGIMHHRTEFVTNKWLAAFANASLLEKYRPWGINLYGYGNDNKNREQDDRGCEAHQ